MPSPTPPTTITVLGATGRLGRVVVARARADGAAVRGLARRAPSPPWPTGAFVAADCRDVDALVEVLDGADVALHLCAFEAADADALLAAWARAPSPPRRLVLASSMAERPLAAWASEPADFAALDAEPAPEDAYGAGKRVVRQRLLAGLRHADVAISVLLLPQVWDAARIAVGERVGQIAEPEARPCVVSPETAAAALWGLARAEPALPGPWQLAPAQRPTRAEWLARTGGVDVFSRGDEPVAGARLRAALPALPWPELG